MKVYSTFMKIVKKNLGTIFMYIGIFVAVSLVSASFGVQPSVGSFEASKISMAVIDRDHTATSQGIYDYLDQTQKLKNLDDDKEVFQDELFYRNVHLIIIIPENFETDLTAGKDIHLESIVVPNSTDGIYVKLQLEQYLSTLKNYLTLGINPQEALQKTNDLMSQQTPVSIQASETAVDSVPKYYNYFALMPYALMGIMVSVLAMVLLAFNEEDLRKRTICSSYPLRKRNLSLSLGSLTIAVAVMLILLILPLLMYGTDMLHDNNYIYLILNAVVMMLFSTSLGFLIGLISKKVEHVAVFSTTFALGLNFLGGIFVPLSIMPKAVINISKFFPTYWYSINSGILSQNNKLIGQNLTDVNFGILIQLAFTVALFGVALVISHRRNQTA
ncbi:MAG: ABC transporter permease [Clostridiales bacterium]|nr:ABC transporter permease [Clostridiales bacterium]